MPIQQYLSRTASSVMPLEMALYLAVQPHGIKTEIAAKNDFDRQRFINQCDIHKPGYQLTIAGFAAILEHTRDPRVMDSICALFSNIGWFELPDMKELEQGDFMKAIGQSASKLGDLSKTVCMAASDHKITVMENAVIQKEGLAVIREAARLMAMADAAAKAGA